MDLKREISLLSPVTVRGRVASATGAGFSATLPGAAIGDAVWIRARCGELFPAEVTSFGGGRITLAPLSDPVGITPGAEIFSRGAPWSIDARSALLGCLLDRHGQIVRRFAEPNAKLDLPAGEIPIQWSPGKTERAAVTRLFTTGIRAIDAFTTLGCGQRIGVFAEPGVGKSSLLGAITRNSSAHVKIVALIGERSREIAEATEALFAGRSESDTIVIACPGAEPPLCRVHAALTAARLAEHFREAGLDVLLIFDSITRVFRALREVGLAAGELPVRQGYPSSVFTRLPRLIEAAGATAGGTITAIYSVLKTADLEEDPLVEEVRGLLDGHIVLSRRIAESGRYPALDISASLSRLQARVFGNELCEAAAALRSFAAYYRERQEFLQLGGTALPADKPAAVLHQELENFLAQAPGTSAAWEETTARLLALSRSARALQAN